MSRSACSVTKHGSLCHEAHCDQRDDLALRGRCPEVALERFDTLLYSQRS